MNIALPADIYGIIKDYATWLLPYNGDVRGLETQSPKLYLAVLDNSYNTLRLRQALELINIGEYEYIEVNVTDNCLSDDENDEPIYNHMTLICDFISDDCNYEQQCIRFKYSYQYKCWYCKRNLSLRKPLCWKYIILLQERE